MWGNQFMQVKDGGYLNIDAGYGKKHEGERLIQEFTGKTIS
ncbi:hypothetical protein [Providencia alcalifaciens]|nr:hypothetical protein [Providencia alcalifaciens]